MFRLVVAAALPLMLLFAAPASAQSVRANLEGFQEVPPISTFGSGSFRARFGGDAFDFDASYDLEGEIQQIHIHFAQAGVNGGIMVFLCTNLGNGPVGTPLCGVSGTSGSISAQDILMVLPQGIVAGDFDAFREAVLDGAAYVNVHSDLFPAGELRGQLPNRGALR